MSSHAIRLMQSFACKNACFIRPVYVPVTFEGVHEVTALIFELDSAVDARMQAACVSQQARDSLHLCFCDFVQLLTIPVCTV